MLAGDGEVVGDAGIGGLEILLAEELPVLVDNLQHHVALEAAMGEEAE